MMVSPSEMTPQLTQLHGCNRAIVSMHQGPANTCARLLSFTWPVMRRMLFFVLLVMVSFRATTLSQFHCHRYTDGLVSPTPNDLNTHTAVLDTLYSQRRDLLDPATKGQKVRATLQDDANFVLYDTQTTKPIWAVKPSIPWYYWLSDAHARSHAILTIQSDGNLVLYTVKPRWDSNTSKQGIGPYCLTISLAGKLVILDSQCTRLWSHDGSPRPDTNASVLATSDFEP
ncbi:Aste57867_7077 [Aphanomyces stellatus]|uniref:Aste57867_7077 protein n=1 Tax=Aphanomyces stellatus TaxID=120398 RepID=A0A485KGA8_9STRA|nr:hypothetical protein As57867_007054 [Aphanomyces stellatus]KAF0719534.1 hypothetical protein As57867_000977 [Aphanomyces stellatus]VFT78200.1 Aste57867_978 [Aphanomyces stellatus]VFT84018.1 Aste57867_7077 [Aphanomyces stellatus]